MEELVPVNVEGRDVYALIKTYINVKGSHSRNAPSDLDYHGHYDLEYVILDEDKNPSEELERTLKDHPYNEESVEIEILNWMEGE